MAALLASSAIPRRKNDVHPLINTKKREIHVHGPKDGTNSFDASNVPFQGGTPGASGRKSSVFGETYDMVGFTAEDDDFLSSRFLPCEGSRRHIFAL